MYTAFLALPPLENQTGTRPKTTVVPEVVPPYPTAIDDLSSIASDTVNSAVTQLNKTLLTDDTVRYVVVPAMFGGLGSVALQMIQGGDTFIDTSAQPAIPIEATANDQDGQTGQAEPESDKRAANDNASIEETAFAHDFVSSIQMHPGIEFLILVASSVLLGAVVGFIGAVLSLDGPPEKASNKSKLAATALMFALFFPSVITVFQRNAISQAELLRADEVNSDLEEKVQEKTQQAENLEEVARKEIIEETVTDPVSAINSAHSLVLNATSDEKAKEAVSRIFTIGNGDNGVAKEEALRVLRGIEENPALSDLVQQMAAEQVKTLNDAESDDGQESQ